MSNSGKEDSNSSQFYVIMKRTAYLNGEFVVFGKIIDGWVRVSGHKNPILKVIRISP